MRFFLFCVLVFLSKNMGKTFPTSHICLPSLHGNTQVASGLIYVKTGDNVKFQKPFGWADYLKQTPFTPHTQIYIGSLKKQFIAAAVLKLMNEGKLKLDDPVRAYLKFNQTLIAKDPAWADTTTIHHLLTHVSNVRALPIQKSKPQLSYLDRLYMGSESINTPLKYQYNTDAYGVLGLIIEVVSGMSAVEYIAENFLKPFGMHQTLFHGGIDVPDRFRNKVCRDLCYPYYFLKEKEVVVSAYNPHIQLYILDACLIHPMKERIGCYS
jgi:CubicO group peptidase (beta-lactamase class C family)